MSIAHSAATFRIPLLLAVIAASLSFAHLAQADTFIVGSGSGCTHNTIQGAIASAEANPANDTIRITRSIVYGQQALVVSTSQVLDITGGYATCAQAASDGNFTFIDGAGGATEPVFRITVNTGGVVNLRYLDIRNGDEDGSGYGGGIYFRGNGILELNDSSIFANKAGYGGGIYAEGTASSAELIIGSNVTIVGNTARFSGGGVYVDGLEMTMTAPGSYIANNHAPGVFNSANSTYNGGYAGGLMVLSGNLPAYAYVGSSSVGTLGPIYLNDARYGGGVAVVSQQTNAELRLFTTNPASPVRIKSNTAVVAGGGIYMQGNALGASPFTRAWYSFLEDNGAPKGAAVYMQGGNDMYLYFNKGALPPGAIACPTNGPCGAVLSNYAENDSGTATGGILELGGFNVADINRIAITGNQGKNVFRGDGSQSGSLDFYTKHILIAQNNVTEQLFATVNDGDHAGRFGISDTTIAGNSIGASSVMRISNICVSGCVAYLYRTIIWQPGKTTLQLTGGPPFDYLSDIVSEVGSLTGSGPHAVVQDPRFVDPARGDFSVRASSPAIDKATTVPNDARDLFGRQRDIDLPIVQNVGMGARDIGAIERQSLQPMMLNSDFNVDLNLWTPVIPNVTTRDNSVNISGPTGSGSAKIFLNGAQFGQAIAGVHQCVHLPGPGTYTVNGWGRSTGNGITSDDSASLKWEFRRDGAESCTQGAPVSSGYLTLSNSSLWRRPPVPAFITVSALEWTHNSSIDVTLVANELSISSNSSTSAWFDGVTIDVIGSDTIFKDGFDDTPTL